MIEPEEGSANQMKGALGLLLRTAKYLLSGLNAKPPKFA
jgi:hypothetical protein